MLVLTRREGEEVLVGDNIRIRVLAVRRRQVRLAFEAPRHVKIKRQEIVLQFENDGELDNLTESQSAHTPL